MFTYRKELDSSTANNAPIEDQGQCELAAKRSLSSVEKTSKKKSFSLCIERHGYGYSLTHSKTRAKRT